MTTHQNYAAHARDQIDQINQAHQLELDALAILELRLLIGFVFVGAGVLGWLLFLSW